MVADLLAVLGPALAGDGPAIAPVAADAGSEQIRAMLRVDVPLERDDIAAVLPTSGSSGEPKGVLVPGSALLHSARATLDRLGGPGRWLLALPPARVAGLQVLVRSLVAGNLPVLMPGRFTPEAFCTATAELTGAGAGAAAAGGRFYTALVPTQVQRLLDAGPEAIGALRSYHSVLVGGGPCSDGLLDRAAAAGVRLVTTYGMTETCGGCVYDGRPLDGVSVDLAPEPAEGTAGGRIRIAGPVVCAGYRLRPDLAAEALVDGWHLTGDRGRFLPDGRLEVLGRLDDIVVSGGVNVPLPAVERAVASYPGVVEAAAVGVPDPRWGARVVAYVVVRPGTPPLSLGQLRDHVAREHPRTYAPQEVFVIDALPTLPSGKLDRAALLRPATAGGPVLPTS